MTITLTTDEAAALRWAIASCVAAQAHYLTATPDPQNWVPSAADGIFLDAVRRRVGALNAIAARLTAPC